jgi:Dimerisation domain
VVRIGKLQFYAEENYQRCDRATPFSVGRVCSSDWANKWGLMMSAITPEPILKIATGFMAAKYLFAASEIGLFEALASAPASVEELAGKVAVPARTVGIVAAAMVSLGLLDQQGCTLSEWRGGSDISSRQARS